MKPQCIGIVGGAGPLAGTFLLNRIFSLASSVYGCTKDADFPKVILMSFPFSEMLSPPFDRRKLEKELSACLMELRSSGATVLAIACHTLHAFLNKKEERSDLVHLPRTLLEEVELSDAPLVFCTSTSKQFKVHEQLFPCSYPRDHIQREVDRVIDQILKGGNPANILKKLKNLLEEESANTVILGCTELSLFAADLFQSNKRIIDPLEVMANKILKQFFLNNRR